MIRFKKMIFEMKIKIYDNSYINIEGNQCVKSCEPGYPSSNNERCVTSCKDDNNSYLNFKSSV